MLAICTYSTDVASLDYHHLSRSLQNSTNDINLTLIKKKKKIKNRVLQLFAQRPRELCTDEIMALLEN